MHKTQPRKTISHLPLPTRGNWNQTSCSVWAKTKDDYLVNVWVSFCEGLIGITNKGLGLLTMRQQQMDSKEVLGAVDSCFPAFSTNSSAPPVWSKWHYPFSFCPTQAQPSRWKVSLYWKQPAVISLLCKWIYTHIYIHIYKPASWNVYF